MTTEANPADVPSNSEELLVALKGLPEKSQAILNVIAALNAAKAKRERRKQRNLRLESR